MSHSATTRSAGYRADSLWRRCAGRRIRSGVLAAIADLLPNAAHNPFPVIVGTSAGAINAVGLACGALHFN